jgi:hypothetical protein
LSCLSRLGLDGGFRRYLVARPDPGEGPESYPEPTLGFSSCIENRSRLAGNMAVGLSKQVRKPYEPGMPTVTPHSSFTFDATVFANALTSMRRPQLDKPVALALVDTAKSGIVKASSLIARRTKLPSAVVKARLSYDHVKIGDYHVIVRSSPKPIPLIDFPGVAQGSGGARINVWGKSQVPQGAFIQTMKCGHRGVYRRVYTPRLPIRQLWGRHPASVPTPLLYIEAKKYQITARSRCP